MSLPTTTVNEVLREDSPVVRLRIVCRQCRLDTGGGRRGGRRGRDRGMSQTARRRIPEDVRRRRQQSGKHLPTLVVSIKVRE